MYHPYFTFTSGTSVPPVIANTGVGAGTIDWQVPRRELRLEEKPLQHLDFILKNVVAEVFGELTKPQMPLKVKAKAEKIVKPYEVDGILREHHVTPINWEAFTHDVRRIQQLVDLWQNEVENARIEDNEQFNREFLLLLN